MQLYKNKLRSVDELPHALVPKKRVAPTLTASGPSFMNKNEKLLYHHYVPFRLTGKRPEGIIVRVKGGGKMQFFAASAAPWILYGCSVVLVPLGIRRFRAGNPLKGFLDLLGAGVIAVMAWTLQNP